MAVKDFVGYYLSNDFDLSIENLLSKVLSYNKNSNTIMIEKAYYFAKKCHKGQFRESGEEYFSHPVIVSHLVADFGMDDVSVIAALLHDVIEDSSVSEKTLKFEFSDEVANLVSGLTKLKNIKFKTKNERDAHRFREFFVSMSSDIRVLIIKLCDRIHNMMTLKHKKNRQRGEEIANETLAVYAPLANLVSMEDAKHLLEDLSFEYLYPNERKRIVKMITDYKDKVGYNALNGIVKEIVDLLSENNIKGYVVGREKYPYSVYKKMEKNGRNFSTLSDIMAFRVIVNTIPECYKVLGVLHLNYKCDSRVFTDYISNSKPNGYRSIHTGILTKKHIVVEIQIRTEKMNKDATMGVAAHWMYKDPSGNQLSLKKYFEWTSKMLEFLCKNEDDDEVFMEYVKSDIGSVHNSEFIYVFDESSKIVKVRRGFTVLDFIIQEIPERAVFCTGCTLNNVPVPLSAVLKNGDIIKVIESDSLQLKDTWLKFVSSESSKKFIKSKVD